MPVFCSSVALLRSSPYCSCNGPTRQTTPSYSPNKKTRRSALLSAILYGVRYPVSLFVSSRRVVGRGVFFFSSHRLSSRLIRPPSHHLIRFNSVSSPVSNIAGRRASRLGLVPSSVSDERGVFVSSVLSHRTRAGTVSLRRPVSSRPSSRPIRVVGRLASLPSSRCGVFIR